MNNFFSEKEQIFSASAPGRMDVMGGISDYSGALLLQMPIKQKTTVQVQPRQDGVFRFRTRLTKNKVEEFSIRADQLKNQSLGESGKIIKELPGGDWAVYSLGCFLVLYKEKGIALTGANVFIQSTVPWGKGVSSSAALEVATMNALNQLYNLSLGKEELAVLAQQAENQVAGAPCGLMDQLSSHLGKKNRLLPLVCQPHEVGMPIPIPRGIYFSGIDSGIRHAVSGASYGDVRVSAFMCYSIIALNEGASVDELILARSSGDWSRLPYKGYLANIPAEMFKEKYSLFIPEEISGKDFLSQYKVSIDTETAIDINKNYKPLVCGSHPVFENERVHVFKTLLKNFKKENNQTGLLKEMGELMMQSHRSYSEVGLGNEYTDELVQMVRDAGVDNSIFGARVSGGGNGGTVCILSYGKEGMQSVKNIYRQYRKKMRRKLFLFTGSSSGAFYLNQ